MAKPVIRIAETDEDFEQARELVYEYSAWLGVDLCFQGFDDEMANFSSVYGPPRGRLLLAMDGADAAGCVGLRPLSAAGEGEIKRLFVRPPYRRTGLGNTLVAEITDAARALGYCRLRLDTLQSRMPAADALYRSLGWVQTPAYYNNPAHDVVFYQLDLGS